MPEPTKAERLLDALAPTQRLISRLKAVMDESMAPARVELSKGTRAKIDSFKGCLQKHIDNLTAQQEVTLALIKRVSDPEAHIVLLWRYGILQGNKVTPWMQISEMLHYEPATFYKYHWRGIDYINHLLENSEEGP